MPLSLSTVSSRLVDVVIAGDVFNVAINVVLSSSLVADANSDAKLSKRNFFSVDIVFDVFSSVV